LEKQSEVWVLKPHFEMIDCDFILTSRDMMLSKTTYIRLLFLSLTKTAAGDRGFELSRMPGPNPLDTNKLCMVLPLRRWANRIVSRSTPDQEQSKRLTLMHRIGFLQ